MDHVIAEREHYDELVEGLPGWFPTRGWMLHWVQVPLWRTAWADQDELRSLNRWQGILSLERLAQTKGGLP